jgi:HEAT repeat protein
MGGTEETNGIGVTPGQADTAGSGEADRAKPGVVINNSQGVQIVLDGQGTQTSIFGGATPPASPDEFRADVLKLLVAVDESACKANLPPFLRPGADVIQMARTVRLLGRVRRPEDEDETDYPGLNPGREHVYRLPAERDPRINAPPQPWEQIAAEYDRLVVLGDPGMGKSWLLRTHTHHLAQVALADLNDGTAVPEETSIPVPVRADVLASRAEATLAAAVTQYLVDEGLLTDRSAAEMEARVSGGGATLLIDALDEVPREAATPGTQAPLKRLEDMLRQWALRCTGSARCVITTRLAGYTGPPVPDAREVELLPFADADITAAVQAWDLPEQTAAELSSRLKDPGVAGMARVPLLLALICSLAADPDVKQPIPHTRAGLYEAVIWQFLSNAHRSTDRGVQVPALDQAGRQNMLRILTRIAISFANTGRGWIDQMPHSELLEAVRSAGDAVTDLGGSTSAVLDRLLGRSGVLVPVGNPAESEQVYVFLHRTIAEYLVARHLSELPRPERMDIVRQHQWFDPDWAEVIPMLGGLLSALPGEKHADSQRRADARALVSDLLGQKHDPLNRAFFTALRILTQASEPDLLLTAAEEASLRAGIYQRLKSGATKEGLIRLLGDAPSWPKAATDGIIDYLATLTYGQNLADSGLLHDGFGHNSGILSDRKDLVVTRILLDRLTDDKKKVRYWTVMALRGREGPAVTDALISCLDDKGRQVRLAAVNILRDQDQPAVTQALTARLNDKDKKMRRAAATALQGRAESAVIQALTARLDDKDKKVRQAAATALQGRAESAVIQALTARLNHQDKKVRRAAATALELQQGPELTEALIARLDDQDKWVRWATAKALQHQSGANVSQALITRLDDKDKWLRRAAAAALWRQQGPGVDEALIARLDDQDPGMRAAAADALRERGGPAVTEALITRLDDKNKNVRRTVTSVLREREGLAVTEALITRLRDKDDIVRYRAADALAQRDGPGVTEALITRLDDQDPGMRAAAADVLRGREGPAVTEALIPRVDDQNNNVRRSVASALRGREGSAVTKALIPRLDDQNKNVRWTVAYALQGREGSGVTQALITRLDDRDQGVRRMSIAGLGNREGADVVRALTGRLGDIRASVRWAAADALATRGEPVALDWLCGRRARLALPGKRRRRYYMAERVVDRLYMTMSVERRQLILRRLDRLTRQVSK